MIPICGDHVGAVDGGQCGPREDGGDDTAAQSADLARRTLSRTSESLRIER